MVEEGIRRLVYKDVKSIVSKLDGRQEMTSAFYLWAILEPAFHFCIHRASWPLNAPLKRPYRSEVWMTPSKRYCDVGSLPPAFCSFCCNSFPWDGCLTTYAQDALWQRWM
jgi:hypothetical protein